MNDGPEKFTVLHGKFAAYLSWSQPFLYALLRGLEPHCRNVIVCHRTENLDRFPIDNIVRLNTRFLTRPAGALPASVYLSKHWQPNLMHAHFGWSGLRMLLLKQFLQIPMVTTFGGKDVGTQMHMPHYDRLYDILLRATDKIVCVSEDLRRQLVEHGVEHDQISVIRRGANLEHFRFVDRSQRDPIAPVRALMVGRIVEKKGHRYAFESIARLVNKGYDVSLTVIGEGEDYHQVRQLRNKLKLKDRIKFVGAVNHHDVRGLMNEADIFLHCSVTGSDGDCEGIPNVVVEAASTGLPIIGTRHGGIVETIHDGRTGLLVPERDVDSLADATERLICNREERLDFGRAAAEFMREEFDLQRQIDHYREIYDTLVGKHRAGELTTPQHFIPDDFSEIMAKTIQPRAGVKEFSLAELGVWMLGPGKMNGPTVSRVNPSIFELLYDLKQYIPQQIKFPVKAVLGRSMAVMVDRLNAIVYRKSYQRLQQTDQSVLEYFRQGGELDAVTGELNAESDSAQTLPMILDVEVENTSAPASTAASQTPTPAADDVSATIEHAEPKTAGNETLHAEPTFRRPTVRNENP